MVLLIASEIILKLSLSPTIEQALLAQYEEDLKFNEDALCDAVQSLHTNDIICPVCQKFACQNITTFFYHFGQTFCGSGIIFVRTSTSYFAPVDFDWTLQYVYIPVVLLFTQYLCYRQSLCVFLL